MKSKSKNFSNVGFILATLGSAVGLGNLWLFPTSLISYGGVAFLIPYIISLFVLGIPFFVLESTLGNKWRTSPVIAYKQYWKRTGPAFGLVQAIGQFIIGTYYVWVVAWILIMFFSSFSLEFGNNFKFMDENVLNITGIKITNVDPSNMSHGGASFWTLFVVLVVFVSLWIIVNRGIKKGVELACKIMIPILFLLLIAFFIYSFWIDGYHLGIEAVFKPDLTKLSDFKAWGSAFGKSIFSLSLVSAIIMIYSSKAPKERDNTTQAFIIVCGDTLIALLGGFIIAATIGGMMKSGLQIGEQQYKIGTVLKTHKEGQLFERGVSAVVEDWKSFAIFEENGKIFDKDIGGSKLIFKTFPVFFKGIGERMNVNIIGNILGAFFFLSAVFAGLSSLIGEVETGTSVLYENTGMKRKYGSLVTILIQFFFGIFFVFNSNVDAMYTLTIDGWMMWLLLFLSLQQALMFATNRKSCNEIIDFNNKKAKIKWNKNFFYFLIVCSFFAILFVCCSSLYSTISEYKDSKLSEVSTTQWVVLTLMFWVPIIIWTTSILWYKKKYHIENIEE